MEKNDKADECGAYNKKTEWRALTTRYISAQFSEVRCLLKLRENSLQFPVCRHICVGPFSGHFSWLISSHTHTHRDTHRHVQTHTHSQNSLPHWPNSTSKHKWNINTQCPGKHTTLILTNTAQPYSCPLRPLKQFKCQNFGVRTTKQLSGILLSRNVLLCGLCVRKGKQPNDMLLLWKIKYFEVIKKTTLCVLPV